MNSLFFHCRAGFETDCAQDLQTVLQTATRGLQIEAIHNSAYVLVKGHKPLIHQLASQLRLQDFIFARQWFLGSYAALDPNDRVSNILQALAQHSGAQLLLESPDSPPGRELAGLCRAIRAPLEQALKQQQQLDANSTQQLHVCFLSGNAAVVGAIASSRASSDPMGIRRLRFPSAAPSRSTLKLDEAIQEFIPKSQQAQRLRPRMKVVDLGAAPGGWTYQMVIRGLLVQAIDNGNMDPSLLASAQVQHQQLDGFTFKPNKAVDWLICDMIEKPSRVAQLLAKWASNRWCREAIVNFKLPMKRRYQELMQCLQVIEDALRAKSIRYELRAKQLYHDRDEVTVHLRILDNSRKQSR